MALVEQACFNVLAELTTVSTVTLDSLSQDERDKERKTYAKGDGIIVASQGGKAENSLGTRWIRWLF